MAHRRIYPVILSGGAGARLWPLSRANHPKQFLPLAGEHTMLQRTVLRVESEDLFHLPLIVANDEHRFIVAEQLRQVGEAVRGIVLEPIGRNTAAAAAAAALILADEDPGAIVALLPSDHMIEDVAVFEAAIDLAGDAVGRGRLVTFGIAPTRPETGYGWIRRGGPLEGAVGCFAVDSFVEKPDAARAADFVADGGYFWNSGMFVFRAEDYLAELEAHAPALLDSCRRAVADARADLDFIRLDREAFAAAEAVSIDRAVMERTASAAVVPVDMGWRDLGTWEALWDAEAKDGGGNVAIGDVVLDGASGSYVRSEDGRLVVALGVEDLIVVATGDAVAVAPRAEAARLGEAVAKLGAEGRRETVEHRTIYRPWGSGQEIDAGDRFKVKRLVVQPGASLSLQRHGRRAEHWVVVRGTARVTRGEGEPFDLGPDQSTYIALGEVHRLANPGDEPLHVIEVQTGDYLEEDDIERLDDVYGRDTEG